MKIDLLKEKIESERLLLVPISLKFKKEIFKEFTEEITVLMNPPSPKNISEVEDFIKKSEKGLKRGDNFQLVILKKDTEEFLGCVGLHNIDKKNPEVGIWVKKSAHGKGYGRESVVAVKKWADKKLDYEYITYPVVKENYPSRKIPESLNGKIIREYDKINMKGIKQCLLDYAIYPPENI